MYISKDRTVLVCYYFIKRLKKLYGSKYTICTDGASYYDQACRWLRIRHHVYNQEDKNIMERAVQYIRIEQSALMITFHAEITVIESMSGTGLECL